MGGDLLMYHLEGWVKEKRLVEAGSLELAVGKP
jgi:hypothetical protein